MHQLTDQVALAFGTPDTTRLNVTVVSFGFKYGIPVDADFVADMRFLPNPFWVPELRPFTGRDDDVADYVKSRDGAAEFLDGYVPVLLGVAEGYLREGKRFMTIAIGCTGGKHRSVAMTEEIARRMNREGYVTRATHRDLGPRVMAQRAQAAVALGGGHGLHASLTALRHLVDDLVVDELAAIVTVADNGGSSGRLRGEFGVLPPGDLRMALAALCGDDDWGRTWSRVVQHRFAGEGEMNGHVVGNLLIVSLWELLGDHVQALDWVGRLLGAAGRVLPMALTPLDIAADVRGLVPGDPTALTSVRGQVEVATTGGPDQLDPAGARRPGGLPRGGRPRSARPTGWCSGPARGSPP